MTGSSAAERIDRTLTKESQRLEGYVYEGTLDDFVKRHLLTRDHEGDVTIYEAPEFERFEGGYASDAVIAVDLARSTTTRERSAGLAALDDMRHAWLARRTR